MEKRTEELKTHVSEAMKRDWIERSHSAGCSPSELLIDLVSLSLYGVTFGEHQSRGRREALNIKNLPVFLKQSSDNQKEA